MVEKIPVVKYEPDELEEKVLTLKIAKGLRRRIINTYGIDTILTRNTDKDMSLDSRVSKANNQKAGLFISIHVNYSFNTSKKGAETYITSFNTIQTETEYNGIKNTDDKNSKKNENNIEITEPEVTTEPEEIVPQKKEELENWDRTQEKYLAHSYKAAQFIQLELNRLNSTGNRKVRQLPIKILSSVSMPSVLIEVAFLSNKSDREKLKMESYLMNISNAIFRGISYYMNSQR